MMKRGIVNVRMVITEEKILSNIEKIHKLINPNNKKQIIELEDNSYFKDLVESVKAYLIEYPKKKNFPKDVYDKCYSLVEYATEQFEDNTKEIGELIKQREYNIKSAAILKQTYEIVKSGDPNWKQSVKMIQPRFSRDVIQSLSLIATAKEKDPVNYEAADKLVNARIENLKSNLHIEIDMERIEDRSKALSYIGIEIADALKQIPTPVEIKADEAVNTTEQVHKEQTKVQMKQLNDTAKMTESAANVQIAQSQIQTQVQAQSKVATMPKPTVQTQAQQVIRAQNVQTQRASVVAQPRQAIQRQFMPSVAYQNQYANPQLQRQAFYNNMYANQRSGQMVQMQNAAMYRQNMMAGNQANYYNPRQVRTNAIPMNNQVQKVQPRAVEKNQLDYSSRTMQNAEFIAEKRTARVKSSIWNKFINSKFVKAIKYALKIRVVLQLPEGQTENEENR